MNGKNGEPNNRELYALLHVSPEASDEEIRTAYRQWAQVYHPDKYQSPQMKEVATVNFQRVREAYEILTDENKRMIYDIYGMDGLTSGLELGHKLNKVDEIKEELERLQRQREQEKVAAHVRSFGSILANLSWPDFLDGDSIMIGMGMASEVQSQISKRTSLAVGGNLAVNTNSGGGAATAILRHHISPVASVEFMGSIGLQSLIGIQTTRELSVHSAAVMGITMSLRDGSINLSNTWSRQLSEKTNGNIQLSLGPESYIGVGWRKKEQKMSASEEIKILLSNNLNPVFATGAFIIPLSLYFTLKNFVFKPYYHRRERQKALENIAKTQSQKRENRNGVIDAVSKRVAMEAALSSSCVFCQIACSSTSTTLLHKDDKIVAFQDINPSAFRHYLVIPIEHIPTVNDLQRRSEDFSLVSNMLNVGQTLLQRDAPHAKHYRFGFHQPPFNSVNHLHLHCFALPFIPRWKAIKYLSLGPFGGFIEAEKLLERIKSLSSL